MKIEPTRTNICKCGGIKNESSKVCRKCYSSNKRKQEARRTANARNMKKRSTKK